METNCHLHSLSRYTNCRLDTYPKPCRFNIPDFDAYRNCLVGSRAYTLCSTKPFIRNQSISFQVYLLVAVSVLFIVINEKWYRGMSRASERELHSPQCLSFMNMFLVICILLSSCPGFTMKACFLTLPTLN